MADKTYSESGWVFKQEDGDYDRYWRSISTPIYKDGEETGKYYQSTIPVRLSKEAQEVFDEVAKPVGAARKNMTGGYFKITHAWLKAASGGRNSKYDVVVQFINVMEDGDEKPRKPAKKAARAKKKLSDDEEDD